MPSTGYHIRTKPWWLLVTIHSPTGGRQHRPKGKKLKSGGFWAGPFPTEQEAQQVAEELIRELEYNEVQFCRTCFRNRDRWAFRVGDEDDY